VLFGPRGGVGCSVIASNLAVGLAQLYGKEVVLIDADLWFGNQAVLFDLPTEKTIDSLAGAVDHLDLDVLGSALVPHPSGVHLLLAPPEPELAQEIPGVLPARAVSAYRTLFDFVIVDTHSSLEDYVVQLLDTADRIMLVTTPELTALHSAAQVLRTARQRGLSNKLMLVLNRADTAMDVEQVERALGRRVESAIVSAGKQMVTANNLGRPLLLDDPAGKQRIARDLIRLAARVAGQGEPPSSDGAGSGCHARRTTPQRRAHHRLWPGVA